MKRNTRIFCLFLIIWCFSLYYHCRTIPAQQTPYIDRAPTGEENVRMIQGQRQRVPIETDVPLDELLQRLEGDWELVSTRKTYWIGYTDDMYSIAAHKNTAIEPLLRFINETDSAHAKYGALLTIHLIGIESKIAGRFYEQFTNHQARDALLQLLSNKKDMQRQVMLLLVRDPWPSDIPTIMDVMKRCESECSFFVNGLFRYRLADIPFWQTIPASTRAVNIYLVNPDTPSFHVLLGKMVESGRTNGFDMTKSHSRIENTIVVYQESFEQESFEQEERVWTLQYLDHSPFEVKTLLDGHELSSLLNDLLMPKSIVLSGFYDALDFYRFQYFVEGDNLFLCSLQVAKQRWLTWYDEQLEKGGPKFLTEEEF